MALISFRASTETPRGDINSHRRQTLARHTHECSTRRSKRPTITVRDYHSQLLAATGSPHSKCGHDEPIIESLDYGRPQPTQAAGGMLTGPEMVAGSTENPNTAR